MINLIFFLPTFDYGGAGNSVVRLCKKLSKKKQFKSIGKSFDIRIWNESDLPKAFLYIMKLKKNKNKKNIFPPFEKSLDFLTK